MIHKFIQIKIGEGDDKKEFSIPEMTGTTAQVINRTLTEGLQ